MNMDADIDMEQCEKKKKTKTKEKKARVPPELKGLKGINTEELQGRYMFPNNPLESWYMEAELALMLDENFDLNGSPPCPRSPIVDAETGRFLEVMGEVTGSIRAQFRKLKSKIINPKAVGMKSLLFPYRGDYLVRRKGRGQVKAKDLKGKYVMVCCCYAPDTWNSVTWKAVYACSEMYTKLKSNFEMVVVIKVRRGWTHPRDREEDAFRRFFSGFPPPCLAVPFHDRPRRHDICYSVGGMCNPKLVLFGPHGKGLLCTHLSHFMNHLPLVPLDMNNGSSDSTPFPFIDTTRQRSHLIRTPSSLNELLFRSSDFVFRKKRLKSGSGSVSFVKEEASLSDLNSSKPVALYLYYSGEQLPLLRHIVQGCDKDLEVMVVNLNTDCGSPSFPELFSTVLAKRDLPWWVVPYNLSASIVLGHLFPVDITWERVIIIGPNDQYVDVRGLRFMQIYGVSAYPFTFHTVVQKTVEELGQLTLDSFLKLLQFQDYPNPNPPTANNKVILFYFDYPQQSSSSVFEKVCRFLDYKEVGMHFVSLVDDEYIGRHAKNLKPQDCYPRDLTFTLSWHTKGAHKATDFFLRFFNHVFPTILAFGEDGRIASLLAQDLPPCDGPPQFKADLFKEVSSILENYLIDYDKKDWFDEHFDHGHAVLQELRQGKLW